MPAPQTPPKHLFHLIIRYEGDGLSDDTVAGLVKQVANAAMVKTDGDAKPKSEPAKGPSLGQLLHFIVRYEGDGIIDANVVALMKEMYGGKWEAAPAARLPVKQYSKDPNERMHQMLNDSENLRQLKKEWERFWNLDQTVR